MRDRIVNSLSRGQFVDGLIQFSKEELDQAFIEI